MMTSGSYHEMNVLRSYFRWERDFISICYLKKKKNKQMIGGFLPFAVHINYEKSNKYCMKKFLVF